MSSGRFGSITVDEGHGAALLRGRALVDVARELGCTPRWSPAGRGWVVDASAVSDVCALAEHSRVTVNYKTVTGAAG